MDPNDGILKIHQWKFSCNQHDEYIARSKLVPVDANAASKKKLKSPKTPTFHTPHSLVNNWGLPQRIYELLRVNNIEICPSFILVKNLLKNTLDHRHFDSFG